MILPLSWFRKRFCPIVSDTSIIVARVIQAPTCACFHHHAARECSSAAGVLFLSCARTRLHYYAFPLSVQRSAKKKTRKKKSTAAPVAKNRSHSCRVFLADVIKPPRAPSPFSLDLSSHSLAPGTYYTSRTRKERGFKASKAESPLSRPFICPNGINAY